MWDHHGVMHTGVPSQAAPNHDHSHRTIRTRLTASPWFAFLQSKTAISHQAVIKSPGDTIHLTVAKGSLGTGRVSAVLVQQVVCQEPAAARALGGQLEGPPEAAVEGGPQEQEAAAPLSQDAVGDNEQAANVPVEITVNEVEQRQMQDVTSVVQASAASATGPQYEVPSWGSSDSDLQVGCILLARGTCVACAQIG